MDGYTNSNVSPVVHDDIFWAQFEAWLNNPKDTRTQEQFMKDMFIHADNLDRMQSERDEKSC